MLFVKEEINLNTLIKNLESLYSNLEYVDIQWKKLFFKEWGKLEDIYSYSIVFKKQLDSQDKLIIIEANKKLLSLIENNLSKYMKEPDPFITKIAEPDDDKWLICPYCFDAWKFLSNDAMVICPNCKESLHNPRKI